MAKVQLRRRQKTTVKTTVQRRFTGWLLEQVGEDYRWIKLNPL